MCSWLCWSVYCKCQWWWALLGDFLSGSSASCLFCSGLPVGPCGGRSGLLFSPLSRGFISTGCIGFIYLVRCIIMCAATWCVLRALGPLDIGLRLCIVGTGCCASGKSAFASER